jgi:tetratricopeptide (TPR) repeat protein
MNKSVKLTQMNDEKVVASRGPGHRKRVLVIAAAVVLVAGVSAICYSLYQKSKSETSKTTVTAVQETNNYKTAMERASALHSSRKDDAAVAELENFRANSQNKQNQASAALQEGAYLEHERKYQEALTVYKFAETVRGNNDLGVSAALGRTNAKLGNKQEAAKYYKNCARLIEGTDDGTSEDVDMYNALAKQLGG